MSATTIDLDPSVFAPTSDERAEVRNSIIREANKFALLRSPAPPLKVARVKYERTGDASRVAPYGSRHVQRAVSVCRRFALVAPDVLTTAGFNPTRKPRARR